MKVLLIHGQKPLRNKALHPDFEQRLGLALTLSHNNNYDLVIISGGQTRSRYPAEASIGYEYLKNQITTPVVLESRSKTTVENILFSKVILRNYSVGQLDVITSQRHLRRFKYLYHKLWPDVYRKTRFFADKDFHSSLYDLVELVYYLYAHIDLQEKWLPKVTKRLFRNNRT